MRGKGGARHSHHWGQLLGSLLGFLQHFHVFHDGLEQLCGLQGGVGALWAWAAPRPGTPPSPHWPVLASSPKWWVVVGRLWDSVPAWAGEWSGGARLVLTCGLSFHIFINPIRTLSGISVAMPGTGVAISDITVTVPGIGVGNLIGVAVSSLVFSIVGVAISVTGVVISVVGVAISWAKSLDISCFPSHSWTSKSSPPTRALKYCTWFRMPCIWLSMFLN